MTSMVECKGVGEGRGRETGTEETKVGREVGTLPNSNTERGEVEIECPGNAELVRVGEARQSKVGANQMPQEGQVR